METIPETTTPDATPTPDTAAPPPAPEVVAKDRPDQIVITLETSLKEAVRLKAKAQGLPMTKAVRKLFQSWVDGKFELPADAPKA